MYIHKSTFLHIWFLYVRLSFTSIVCIRRTKVLFNCQNHFRTHTWTCQCWRWFRTTHTHTRVMRTTENHTLERLNAMLLLLSHSFHLSVCDSESCDCNGKNVMDITLYLASRLWLLQIHREAQYSFVTPQKERTLSLQNELEFLFRLIRRKQRLSIISKRWHHMQQPIQDFHCTTPNSRENSPKKFLNKKNRKFINWNVF